MNPEAEGMRGRSHDVTTRNASSTRYWMFVAAYVAVLPLILGVAIFSEFSSGAEAFAIMYPLGIAMMVGLVAAPVGMFKDAIYLREVKANWRPQWWRYFSVIFGIPVIGTMTSGFLGVEEGGWVIGIFIFVFTMWFGATHYIYRRHQTIGVP